MPHRPEPFYRPRRDMWYVQVEGREHKLARDRAEAFKLYHKIMSREPGRAIPAPSSGLVVQLVDDFLEWAQHNRSPATYRIYAQLLQSFVGGIPPTLAISELRPFHVTKVMDANSDRWRQNTKRDFAATVQRAFNWAERQGMIDRSPIRHLEKPPAVARELIVRPVDHDAVMAAVREPNFRDLLELAWETGSRPVELRKIEARHIDGDRIVFPPTEAKGKRKHRVIYLGTDKAREIVARLSAARPSGCILLNSEGQPWNKDSINCAFFRLKKKLGVKFHLGAWRKGYCTQALKNGVDVIGLAHLMGHSNAAMISKVYGRVQQDPEYMAGLAERAKAPRKA